MCQPSPRYRKARRKREQDRVLSHYIGSAATIPAVGNPEAAGLCAGQSPGHHSTDWLRSEGTSGGHLGQDPGFKSVLAGKRPCDVVLYSSALGFQYTQTLLLLASQPCSVPKGHGWRQKPHLTAPA